MTEESKIEKSDSEYRVVGPPGCGIGGVVGISWSGIVSD